MLADTAVSATIAVRDLDVATRFYENVLGLKRSGPDNPGGVQYKTGNSLLMVYPSQYAGTNQATAATWIVDNVDEVVRELKAKGVTFEHYDMPETTREGDVHVAGGVRVAWFKDPDGNIHALVNG